VRNMCYWGHLVAAICHGPQVLISAGLLKGKKATCFSGMKDDLINAGATYVDAPVVVDGNLITSPHYRNNPEFMKAILEQYHLRENVVH
jgi:protease I